MKKVLYFILLSIVVVLNLKGDEYLLNYGFDKIENQILGVPGNSLVLNSSKLTIYSSVIAGRIDTLEIVNDSVMYYGNNYKVSIIVDTLLFENDYKKYIWSKCNKTIFVFVNSDDEEKNSDIVYSANQILTKLDENNIQVIFSEYETNYAYLLIDYRFRRKQIYSVLTDIDLLDECRNFFRFEFSQIKGNFEIYLRESSNYKDDLKKSLEKKDYRFIAVYGYTIDVPGIENYSQRFSSKYKLKIISNTSDSSKNEDEMKKNNFARNYAENYNILLLQYLVEKGEIE